MHTGLSWLLLIPGPRSLSLCGNRSDRNSSGKKVLWRSIEFDFFASMKLQYQPTDSHQTRVERNTFPLSLGFRGSLPTTKKIIPQDLLTCNAVCSSYKPPCLHAKCTFKGNGGDAMNLMKLNFLYWISFHIWWFERNGIFNLFMSQSVPTTTCFISIQRRSSWHIYDYCSQFDKGHIMSH